MRGGKASWGIAVAIPVAFLAAFFLWPVSAMLIRGLSSGGQWLEVLWQERTWRIIWQTVWMALAGTAASLMLGVPGAYVLYRLRIPCAALWRGIVAVPFVLPTVVVGIAFRALLDGGGPLGFLGLSQSSWAVVLAMVFFNYSLVVRTVGAMWASLDPRQTQAARTLGASSWRAFYSVTLPQLTPAIAAAASLVFLYCSTAYGLVTALGRPGYGTIETEIYIQTVTFFNLDKAAILSCVQFILVAVALIVSSRLSARAETSLRVSRPRLTRPSSADIFAVALTSCTVMFLLLPMVTLAVRSFRSDGQWSFINYQLLATPGEGFAGGVSVGEALVHSLSIAVDATMIALALGLLLAYVLSRRVSGSARLIQRFVDACVLLPLGVSSVTVGFGMLITLGLGPMARSAWLVPIAQSIVALPLVIRAIVPVVRGIDPDMRAAAASLGARPLRVLVTIDLPLAWRGIMLACGFAFSISLGEFGATSFLARPDFQTLPVLIVKVLGRPGEHNYGMALAGAVVLAVIVGGVMMLAEVFSAREKRGAL